MTLDDKMNRGKAALAAGRYAEAETMFVTLADEYPASPRPFAALFKTYMDQGKKAEAIDALEKKLEREPDAAQRAWLDQFKAQP
jgi:predicted Zn-dependent protease